MIRLSRNREPQWIDLGLGVRVKAKPLSFSRYHRVLQSMSSIVQDAAEVRQRLRDLGAEVGDTDTPSQTELLALSFARELIIEWDGVGDEDGNPAPLTPENLFLFVDHWYTGPTWWKAINDPILGLEQEKNGSRVSPDGISEGAQTSAGSAEIQKNAAPPADVTSGASTVPTENTPYAA